MMAEEWLERVCQKASIGVLAKAIADVAPERVIAMATPEELAAAEVIVERGRLEIDRLHD